jgi:two-component sensor histidine kinase/putative methionine-R-sulfoxide reductase with GAF domain
MPGRASTRSIEERLVRMGEYQQALVALSRAASEPLPLDRLMHYVAAHVSAVTHISRVKVMRYRADRGDLLICAGVGWKDGVVGHTTLAIDSASPAGRSVQTASSVIVEDLPNDPEFRQPDVLREHGIVSLLNVPIMMDGRTWGVLEVDSDEPRQFDDDDVCFLIATANVLGSSLLRHETEGRAAEAAAAHAEAQSRAEILLRELQHRAKNNLQTIISFLALQRRRTENVETREKLGRVMDRVHAIALAHDQLALGTNAGQVDLGDYLRALCANIDPQREGITIEVNVTQGFRLSLDRAVPAGLIVNELVTNSLKHAFGENGGAIRVTFSTAPDRGEAHLTVADNGRGMQQARSGGMGLVLISAFAKQLSGRVEAEEVAHGTCIRIRFPLPT